MSTTQDLAPIGGYKPLDFTRKPARQVIPGRAIIGIFLTTTFSGLYLMKMSMNKFERDEIEQRSSMLALTPMLIAERDRAYLKQLRKNRDEETELMKDVEGWVVGTWFGQPIYNNFPKDKLLPPNHHEFYAHSSPSVSLKWNEFMSWS